MKFSNKAMLSAAAAAMLATTPMPSFAASFAQSAKVSDVDVLSAQSSDYHRRRYRHRDRVDAGDILTGIGILAGIAIIADAASKSDRNERNEPRYEERNDNPPIYRDDDMGSAVNACSSAAERSAGDGARVREIRSVTRDGSAWRVAGDLDSDNARSFDCAATGGQVDYVRLDDGTI